MSLGFAAQIIRSAVFHVLLIGGPALLVGMVVGLIISIFQATTSIQEQTLTFVPKIAAILITIAVFIPWMFSLLRQYTITIFGYISQMGG